MYLVYYAPARVTSCCLVTQSKLAGLIQRNVVSVTSIYYYSHIIKCRVCTSSDCYECNKARVTLHLNLIVFHLADYYIGDEDTHRFFNVVTSSIKPGNYTCSSWLFPIWLPVFLHSRHLKLTRRKQRQGPDGQDGC